MKLYTDQTQPEHVRDKAYQELKEINKQMKANLDTLVKEASDKWYQEKYNKEQKEKYDMAQKKAGKDPYDYLNGYQGKTYPGMKDAQAGAGILIWLSGK